MVYYYRSLSMTFSIRCCISQYADKYYRKKYSNVHGMYLQTFSDGKNLFISSLQSSATSLCSF